MYWNNDIDRLSWDEDFDLIDSFVVTLKTTEGKDVDTLEEARAIVKTHMT